MLYEVQSRVDFTGAALVVRFPKNDLDRKALNTIQAENPAFLLPFTIRAIDEMIECTYEIGSNIKLMYQSGQKTQNECVAFWEMILQPLIDCDDWFMDPFCFALRPDLVFLSKSGKEVKYVYIPSRQQNVSLEELLGMVRDLSKSNPVTDMSLENKILRAIMEDFNPVSFLRMLREHIGVKKADSPMDHVLRTPARAEAPTPAPVPQPSKAAEVKPAQISQETPVQPSPAPAAAPSASPKSAGSYGDPDIVIDFGGSGKSSGKGKKEKPVKQPKVKPDKAVKVKPPKEEKKRGGLFGSKKGKDNPQGEQILYVGPNSGQYEPEIKREPARKKTDYNAQAVSWADDSEDDAVTYLDGQNEGTGLQLIGDRSLPARIDVNIPGGGAFTIGRFDVNLGKQQNDFEFSKDKKFISRRHAVIERSTDGRYYLIDLSSMGGTFLNDRRLQPNVPELLGNGCRVSFGNEGADYVWRE